MRLLPLILSSLLLAAAASPAVAQAQKQPAAPAVAPAKPYKVVTIKLPTPINDPSLEAFRKQLGEAAEKKDRAALAKLVVAQGFFWDADSGDKADKKKSGIDNLASAIGLAGKDASGWDLLSGYAADPTASSVPEHKGAVCTPADPAFDDKELEDIAKATGTDPAEWGYPTSEGVEVRSAAQASAPVIEKLGLHFIRVMPDVPPGGGGPGQAPLLKIVLPSGKIGYVSADSIAPLGNDQICYIKDANGWKIAGFIGAGAEDAR